MRATLACQLHYHPLKRKKKEKGEKMTSLTNQVLRYQRTGDGLADLIESVSCYVYDYPAGRGGFDEDDRGDFFLYIRKRIPSFINNYRYSGKPFEAYLNACLRWQLRTFGAQKIRQSRRHRVSNAPDRWEEIREAEIVAEPSPSPSYGYDPATHGGVIRMPKEKQQRRAYSGRRLVILAMKGCLRLQRDDITTLSHVTGFCREELLTAWKQLRYYTERRLSRLQALRSRRNRIFFRVLCLQDELANREKCLQSGETHRELERQKTRLASLREQISRVRLAPSNREIAEVCQIPKGSVDSTLYYMRTLWTRGSFPPIAECEFIGGPDM